MHVTTALTLIIVLLCLAVVWLAATSQKISHYLDVPTVAAHDRVPTHAHPTDAGADLRLNEDVSIPAGGTYLASTGVSMAIPKGFYAEVNGHSSLDTTPGLDLTNHVEIIDPE